MPTMKKTSQFAENASPAAARDRTGKVIQGSLLKLNCGHTIFRKVGYKGCRTICEICRGKEPAFELV